MTTTLRTGQIVRYDGTRAFYRGMMFRVVLAYLFAGQQCYDLAFWQYGETADPNAETVLVHARRDSLTPIAARDILDRTCKDCGWEYWYLRGTEGACPIEEDQERALAHAFNAEGMR